MQFNNRAGADLLKFLVHCEVSEDFDHKALRETRHVADFDLP
jgi:hypothetical protein